MQRQQRGAVLIVSLMILILLTLLALTAIRASTVQEKIAGNTRNMDAAFQAAEAALRQGESFVEVGALPAPGTGGFYHFDLSPAPNLSNPSNWTGANSREATINDTADQWDVAAAPRYMVEELPPIVDPEGSLEAGAAVPDGVMYKVSARGTGTTENTYVILQTTYRR